MSSVTAKIDLTPVQSDLATVLDRLTSARAGNLDNLNTTISSRAAQTTADTLATRLSAARGNNLDNLNATITSRATQTTAQATLNRANALPVTPIKSVQRGTIEWTGVSGGTTKDITISAVNRAKCLVFVTGSTNKENDYFPFYEFPSNTVLRLKRRLAGSSASITNASWEVVEYV